MNTHKKKKCGFVFGRITLEMIRIPCHPKRIIRDVTNSTSIPNLVSQRPNMLSIQSAIFLHQGVPYTHTKKRSLRR